ncbi:6-bladed beta-propeller [Desulfobacterales bacterium HSG17]|nr:6-bladed beta-propeller [Desulfobacterales bacterium HSG17]
MNPLYSIIKTIYYILIILLLYPVYTIAEEYRFIRMWPTLQQPWYFNHPQDLTTDSRGYVYIADTENFRVQKFTADGQFITRWDIINEPYFFPPQGIASDSDDFIYVTDTRFIRKYTSDGVFVMKWGLAEGSLFTPFSVETDEKGYIYAADKDNSCIYVFDSEGSVIGKWGEKGEGNGEFLFPSGIATDNNGIFFISDTERNCIQKFNVKYISNKLSVEFVKKWGTKGKENGQFDYPFGLEFYNGYLYAVDMRNDRIQKFDLQGNFIDKWGTEGSKDGEFYAPAGITVDKNGHLYVADQGKARIQKFTEDGKFISNWESRGGKSGEFERPAGISQDENGNIYVVDKNNNRIQKFNKEGIFQTQWGEPGAEPGQFDTPFGIAYYNGFIFVTDTSNNRVQKFSTSGDYSAQWLNPGDGETQFNSPEGIGVDDKGNVYIADTGNHRICKLTYEGIFIKNWGKKGTQPGEFYKPKGIAGSDSLIYVSDSLDRIQKFDLDGTFIEKWGETGNQHGQFDLPTGLAIDENENIYVADNGNNRIQKFDSNGNFLTSFGDFGSGAGLFKFPYDLCISSNGMIYVSDTENNRIQAFQLKDSAQTFRAIIVAGGGPYTGNNLWDSTRMCANFAYRTLNYQGFTKDDIFYLTEDTELDLDNNGKPDDVDGIPTKANLRNAITDWGKDAQTLVLYITDHGGNNIFRMSKNENLSAPDLDSWLDDLQNQTSAKVILIYDACESGSFLSQLKPPDGKERIILFSTSPGESAYFVTQGSISFSNYFWTDIFNGKDVFQAFKSAENAISQTMEYQNPLIDDTGDGISDASDGVLAQKTYIGNATQISGENPVIGQVSPEQNIINTNTAILRADSVTDEDGIARVWAVIRPPGYSPGDSNNTVQSLPSVEYTQNEGSRYEAVYDDFNFNGTYEIAVYARDNKGNTSSPAFTRIRVNDPLHRKAVIVAGGTESDSLWPAVENNTGLAYESLKFQGYSDDDIYFLSSVVFSPGIDGFSSLSNLEFALGAWAENNTKDVILYLIGNGQDKAFNLNQTEKLKAENLDKWLDALQKKIPGEIAVIYDAPLSASFIPELISPEGKNRIVITSTSGIETAYFFSNGDISFSQFFWNRIANGSSIYTAFVHAKNAIWFATGTQTPQIDDNGNGIGNEKYDGILARKNVPGTGIFLTGNAPTAQGISSNQSLYGQVSASIEIENINTTGNIEKVWAVISPPVEFQFPGDPIENLPTIELDNNSGFFQGTYDSFTSYGDYMITAYVRDTQGNISEPLTSVITQEFAPDVFEDDNTAIQAGYITLNSAGLSEGFETPGIQTHNFHEPGDEDWVQFYAVTRQPYVIETTNPGNNTDTVITLFASDRVTQLMQQDQWQDNLEGKGELLSWTCEAEGIYYVRIAHHDADISGTGTGYDLKIYGPQAPLGGFIKGSITDFQTGLPVTGAIVTTDANASSVSRPGGRFLMIQEPGNFSISINADGYEPITTQININEAGIAQTDFKLIPIAPPEPEPVNTIPSVYIISPSSDLTIIAGESVNLTASVVYGEPPFLYYWDFDNGPENSGLLNPGEIIFNKPGIYNIIFTATDFNGDSGTAEIEITVKETPKPETPEPEEPETEEPDTPQTDTDEPDSDDKPDPGEPVKEIIQALQPEIIYPGNDENKVLLPLTLRASLFTHSHEGYSHLQTRWQLSIVSDFSSPVADISTTEHLADFLIPESAISYNSEYYCRVKFYDNQNNESQWSPPVRFFTASPDEVIADDDIDMPEETQPNKNSNEIYYPQPPPSENVGGAGCFINSISLF